MGVVVTSQGRGQNSLPVFAEGKKLRGCRERSERQQSVAERSDAERSSAERGAAERCFAVTIATTTTTFA